MVQHSIDREPGIRQNLWFTDWWGSGNPGLCVNHPDVLNDEAEPSRE
jgi:hypothetical protein